MVKVDKIRRAWLWRDWEIDLDLVKGLGDFVEIEYIGAKKVDPEKVASEMVEFLKKLGCGKIKIDYLGYPFRLLFPNEVKP